MTRSEYARKTMCREDHENTQFPGKTRNTSSKF